MFSANLITTPSQARITRGPNPQGKPLTNRITATALAILTAATLAACSAPATATTTPAATQMPSTAISQPSATASAEPAAPTAAPTRSPGPGSVKSEPGEDVYDFNIRQMFWALVTHDADTAAKFESSTLGTWHKQIGYHAPNSNMDLTCTLGARIPSTPERVAAIPDNLHKEAMSVPGVKTFAYPLTCPNGPNTYIIVAAVNPSLHVEEINYEQAKDVPVFGVPDLNKSPK